MECGAGEFELSNGLHNNSLIARMIQLQILMSLLLFFLASCCSLLTEEIHTFVFLTANHLAICSSLVYIQCLGRTEEPDYTKTQVYQLASKPTVGSNLLEEKALFRVTERRTIQDAEAEGYNKLWQETWGCCCCGQ